jgi:hypothetical protein
MATPSSGGIGIFENNAEDRKIYVPVGSGKAYKTANAWKEYAYAIREYDFESGEVIVEDPVLTLTSESEISFSADGGNGEIGYTLENPVEGINVVADSDAEWITNFAVAKDKITFKVAANENKEPRTATITVEYGVLSFNVKITQEAKAGQSNNEIWYTSSNDKIVEPYSGYLNNYADALTTFGANIVSNSYNDGEGVITFDGDITTIGDWAFSGCYSLTSVTIGDSVTTIGNSAFYGCTSLKEFKGKFASDNGRCLIVDGVLNSFAIGCGATEYTIPDSVTTIGYAAFYNCYSLTSVTIGDSVTTIGYKAFWHCSSLTSVTIPDSGTLIGSYTFERCDSLTSVTIGDGVTTIGDEAFAYCPKLHYVSCKPTTPPTLGNNAFSEDNLQYIYVPSESVEEYREATRWRYYEEYIEGYDF